MQKNIQRNILFNENREREIARKNNIMRNSAQSGTGDSINTQKDTDKVAMLKISRSPMEILKRKSALLLINNDFIGLMDCINREISFKTGVISSDLIIKDLLIKS